MANKDKENGDIYFSTIRDAKFNRTQDRNAIARLLWRDEALEELSKYGLDSGIRTKQLPHLWERLSANLTLDQLLEVITGRLLERQEWRSKHIAHA